MPQPSQRVKSLQRGSMQEVNLYVWPALYGYAGWLWGSTFGWPVLITLAGVVAGLLVGGLKMTVSPFGIELLAFYLVLGLPWFMNAETWRWTVLVLCAVPLPRLIIGLITGMRWDW